MRVQRVDEEDRPPSNGTLDYRWRCLFGVSGRAQGTAVPAGGPVGKDARNDRPLHQTVRGEDSLTSAFWLSAEPGGQDGPYRPWAVLSEGAKLPWTELAFADHPLVPVYFVFDPIMRRIALAKQNANDFKAALGGMLDTPLWEEFNRLADVVFVF